MLRRSNGWSRRSTLSRRPRRGRRPEPEAIERLEERVLLAATTIPGYGDIVIERPMDTAYHAVTSGDDFVKLTDGTKWRSGFMEIVSPPEIGELEEDVDEAGWVQLRYRPPAGFAGEVGFLFRITTIWGNSEPANATIIVRPDSPPVAENRTYVVRGPFTGSLSGSDPDGGSVSFEIVDAPATGLLSHAGGRTFEYTPPEGFSGEVEFTYRTRQRELTSEPAKVSLHVVQTRVVQTLAADLDVTIRVREGGGTVTRVVGSNGRSFDAYELVSPPSVGDVEFLPGTADGIVYHPPAGFFGEVTFAYHGWDGYGWSTAGTVTVSVVLDTVPVVSPVALTARSGETLNGRLVGHDAEGDPFVYAVDPPTVGAFDSDPWSGEFVYTPPAGFTGVVTFHYAALSAGEWSTLATVTITVESPNAAPNAAPAASDVTLTPEPAAPEIGGRFAGEDADGDALTYEVVTPPEFGTVDVIGDSFVWREPAHPGWALGHGPRAVTFTYRAWDGTSYSEPATVTISFPASSPPSNEESIPPVPEVVPPLGPADPPGGTSNPPNAGMDSPGAGTGTPPVAQPPHPPGGPDGIPLPTKPPAVQALLNLITKPPETSDGDDRTRLATAIRTAAQSIAQAIASALQARPGADAAGPTSPGRRTTSVPRDEVSGPEGRSSVFDLDWTEVWDRRDGGPFTAPSAGAIRRAFTRIP